MTQNNTRKARKEARLRNRSDIQYVKNFNRKAVGRFCVLETAPARDNMIKLTIVISRHFSTKAVHRNRARRLLKESWRLINNKPGNQWYLLRPRKKILKAKSTDVEQDLQKLLEKATIQQNDSLPCTRSQKYQDTY